MFFISFKNDFVFQIKNGFAMIEQSRNYQKSFYSNYLLSNDKYAKEEHTYKAALSNNNAIVKTFIIHYYP